MVCGLGLSVAWDRVADPGFAVKVPPPSRASLLQVLRNPCGSALAREGRGAALQERHWRSALVQCRAPKHPPQDPDVLLFDLRGPERLIRVFGAVVAAQSQSIPRRPVQVLDTQHSVVLDRVNFPIHDLRQAPINGDG